MNSSPTSGLKEPWYSPFSSCLSSCVEGKEATKRTPTSVIRKQPVSNAYPHPLYAHNPLQASWNEEASYRTFTPEPYQRNRSYTPTGKRRQIRRSQISSPSEFRHLTHETIDLPGESNSVMSRDMTPTPIQRPRRASYRPLELSIFLPNSNLSPLWPHFGLPEPSLPDYDDEEPVLAPPPAAVLADARDDAYLLSNQRSTSAMSFHLPRRASSQRSSSRNGSVRSRETKPRPVTGIPEVSSLVQRIASAMIDLEQLQGRIEEVAERQSVYLGGQSFGFSLLQQSLNRIPTPPNVPAGNGSSFAERMRQRPSMMAKQSSLRPQTAILTPKQRPQTMIPSPGNVVDVPLSAVSERHESSYVEAGPLTHESHYRPSSVDSFVSALSERPESVVSNHSLVLNRAVSMASSLHLNVTERRESIQPLDKFVEEEEEYDSEARDAVRPLAHEVYDSDEYDSEYESDDDDNIGSRRSTSIFAGDEHPMMAMMAIAQRPNAIMTKRKRPVSNTSTTTTKQQRRRTIISGKRPITLLTPARVGVDDEKKALRPASSAAALKVWPASPSSVAVETASLPKTPNAPPPSPPNYPSLRKKHTLSTLNWHLLPQSNSGRPLTMAPPAQAGRSREGYYSYVAPRKAPATASAQAPVTASARTSMDSLSSSVTASTAESEEEVRPQEERLSYISVTAADESDVYIGVDVSGDADNGLSAPPSTAHSIDGADSKHVSFDFGLLGPERITMTFEPAKRVSAVSTVSAVSGASRVSALSDEPFVVEGGTVLYRGATFGLEPERKSVGVAY